MTVDEAYALCTQQAQEHYENFPVGSFLLPARERKHIHAVYAFARTADDFADETFETLTREERVQLLDRWEENLDACLKGSTATRSSAPCMPRLRNVSFHRSFSAICSQLFDRT